MRKIIPVALLLSGAAWAEDPMLKYRAPSLVRDGGAFSSHQRSTTAPQRRHAAEINARAQTGIETITRDNMRSIDDGVMRRLGTTSGLPQVRLQREIEEDRAAMRYQGRLDAIRTDLGDYRDDLGRPLGPVTRHVLERSGVPLHELRERKWQIATDLEALEREAADARTRPEISDLVPRESRPRDWSDEQRARRARCDQSRSRSTSTVSSNPGTARARPRRGPRDHSADGSARALPG